MDSNLREHQSKMTERRTLTRRTGIGFWAGNFLAAGALLLHPSLLVAQYPASSDPRPLPGVEFILKSFDQYQAVGIGDLPGCEEAHDVIRSLILNPSFSSKVNDIVVDFGNPLMQPVVDRYLLERELVPRGVLRRVWEDTTRSVDLTWDSPVYEQLFDVVRSINATLPRDKRVHVVVADAPIDWTGIKQNDDLAPILELRAKTLADSVNALMARGRHELVISFATQQFRTGMANNARVMIERANPGKFFSIVVQGRFGGGGTYKAVEARQSSWDLDTVATVRKHLARLGASFGATERA